MDDGYVAWKSYVENDIYYWDAESGGTTRVTNNVNSFDGWPSIDYPYLVWTGSPNRSDDEVWLYNLETGASTPLTNDGDDQTYAKVDDGWVAWCNRGPDGFLWLYDIAAASYTKVADHTGTETEGRYDVDDGRVGVAELRRRYRSSDKSVRCRSHPLDFGGVGR